MRPIELHLHVLLLRMKKCSLPGQHLQHHDAKAVHIDRWLYTLSHEVLWVDVSVRAVYIDRRIILRLIPIERQAEVTQPRHPGGVKKDVG
uniref:Uncharacterized protein n=1 Tax=Leersia perrieri TaxID=77586 RepID=A0A0D9XV20_9ORYZ